MEAALPEENKASNPRRAGHNGCPGRKQARRCQPTENGWACQEAGIWERSAFQASSGCREEAGIIHGHSQRRAPHTARARAPRELAVRPASAEASLSPGKGDGLEHTALGPESDSASPCAALIKVKGYQGCEMIREPMKLKPRSLSDPKALMFSH